MRRVTTIAAASTMAAFDFSAMGQEADPAIETDGDSVYSMEENQADHTDLTEETFTSIEALLHNHVRAGRPPSPDRLIP